MQDFKQILTKDSYSRQEEVIFGQCDRNEKLRMAGLLDKVACFGGFDYDARGITRELLMQQGCVFLLSRVSMRIHRRPAYRDVLTVQTWENGAKGPYMQRVFQMTDQTEELCVSSRSDWVMVEPEKHKIVRPRSFAHKDFGLCPQPIDCPQPKRISLPKEGGMCLGVRKVAWTDLDGNGHLYSGRYGDIIWDFLPEDVRELEPQVFHINYIKEATLGQELTLRGFREEGTYSIEGTGANGICFTAQCIYEG